MQLTSLLSQPIISPYETWWQIQYVGSLGSTGISSTSDGCPAAKSGEGGDGTGSALKTNKLSLLKRNYFNKSKSFKRST